MSGGIVPKTCNKKASKHTKDETTAHKKIRKLSAKRKKLWAKYRGTELPKRVHTEAQKARATETLAARRAADVRLFKKKERIHQANCRARRSQEKIKASFIHVD
ncbi:unnamed protein product [Jaminaea pallidilutea]